MQKRKRRRCQLKQTNQQQVSKNLRTQRKNPIRHLDVEAVRNHPVRLTAIDLSKVVRAKVHIERAPVRIVNRRHHAPHLPTAKANQNTQTKTPTVQRILTIDHLQRIVKTKMVPENHLRRLRHVDRPVTITGNACDRRRLTENRKAPRQKEQSESILMHSCTNRIWKKTMLRRNAE